MQTTTTRSDAAEVAAIGVLCSALLGFGTLGFVTHSPSTVSYLCSVVAVAVVLVVHRRTTLSPTLTLALAGLAVAHLAGGLVNVGDDVLYNAYLWAPVLEYDHFVHASGPVHVTA
jgi:ABC-type Fe3+-siderophore transport system permease subunit